MPAGTLWLDVTSVMSFHGRRLTGIPRVELDMATRLAATRHVEFVIFDERRGGFLPVSAAELTAQHRSLAADETAASTRSGAHRLRRILARLAARCTPRFLRSERLVELALASAQNADDLVANLVTAGREMVRLTLRSAARRHRIAQNRWRPGDVYLCVGLHRTATNVDAINAIAFSHGVRVVRFVYDLTPVILPQFTTYSIESQRSLFRSCFQATARMIAISHCTADDIRAFCKSEDLPCPPIEVIPPASALWDGPERRPLLPEEVTDFVLCVGTIEPRKNHQLLLDVWQDLIRRDDGAIPHLVIAGSIGWLNNETVSRLRHTPEFAGRVSFVESPSDPELRWLYRHCLLTVYPSLYEGWGLPVSESLTAGKMCVTSDRASLPEAGQGLTIALDATDRRLWSETILDLCRDRDGLRAAEERIRREYRPRSVDDVVTDVLRVVDQHEGTV